MSDITNKNTTRRDFLKDTGRIAATSAFMAAAVPKMYAGQSNTIKVALIGCGGRGTGAADNALSVKNGPIKLVAMGDVFERRLKNSYANLKKMHESKVDVPEDRQFIGFDAYKKAMDCLSPGDVAIFASPPAFRWVHFTYAIKKGLNVFMEKPVTVDGPTSRRMFELAKQSEEKNLKVGVGLMSRHSRALEQLYKRIQNGEIGDIIMQRGYRMHGPVGFFSSLPKPPGISELLYQVQRFHSFIWASGGNFNDFYIHIIDHQCWMKNDWPVKAQALGGRHYKQNPDGITYVDQNFDTYSVEYTYPDGAKLIMDGRCIDGCYNNFSSAAHGSKGMAIVSKDGDCGMPSSIHEGQNPTRSNMIWESRVRPEERNPYQNEWNDLIDAIRNDKPYNEAERGVKASLVTSLGRMAAHTGQEVTYEQILNSDHEMAPSLDELTMNSPAPLKADSKGRYPVPQPGIIKDREY
ncbi:MAG: Gfo/Idh/MocA family oxidoreductase [Sedimentisphaerales bacterium]|nr:Gfo/Idh/MocA family oxidoreductase [Sedimentisphaerales bacterium]